MPLSTIGAIRTVDNAYLVRKGIIELYNKEKKRMHAHPGKGLLLS